MMASKAHLKDEFGIESDLEISIADGKGGGAGDGGSDLGLDLELDLGLDGLSDLDEPPQPVKHLHLRMVDNGEHQTGVTDTAHAVLHSPRKSVGSYPTKESHLDPVISRSDNMVPSVPITQPASSNADAAAQMPAPALFLPSDEDSNDDAVAAARNTDHVSQASAVQIASIPEVASTPTPHSVPETTASHVAVSYTHLTLPTNREV